MSTISGNRTETVHVSQVRPGDLVTEIGSPEGPYYPVLLSVPGLLRIDGRAAGDLEPLPVDLAVGLTSGVVRLVTA